MQIDRHAGEGTRAISGRRDVSGPVSLGAREPTAIRLCVESSPARCGPVPGPGRRRRRGKVEGPCDPRPSGNRGRGAAGGCGSGIGVRTTRDPPGRFTRCVRDPPWEAPPRGGTGLRRPAPIPAGRRGTPIDASASEAGREFGASDPSVARTPTLGRQGRCRGRFLARIPADPRLGGIVRTRWRPASMRVDPCDGGAAGPAGRGYAEEDSSEVA